MRCCAFLCASADLGVRFSYRAISFCSASCIVLLRQVGLSFGHPVAGLFPAVSINEENFAVSAANCVLYFTPSNRLRRIQTIRQPDDQQALFRGKTPWLGVSVLPRGVAQTSKHQLQCELNLARLTELLRLAEIRAVRDIAVRAVQLRMVEQVVDLRPEVQLEPFGQSEALEQADIEIEDSRIA